MEQSSEKYRFLLVSVFLLFLPVFLNGQYKKIIINYPSKAVYASGKVLKCEGYDNEPFCDKSYMSCRRVGTWNFYYENGRLEHTEEYRWLTSCDSVNCPEGMWKYYDKFGSLEKEDEYRDGKAWNMLLHNYSFEEKWAGEVRIHNGKQDTVLDHRLPNEKNDFIDNNSFELYTGDAVQVSRPGQMRIEEQIPCWFNPKGGTPDYYNPFRRLDGVPDNYFHSSNEKYSYVGLILFQYPNVHYSECITAKLKKELIPEKEYCFRMRIRLSQNSGYYLSSMGVLFTKNLPKLYAEDDGSLHYVDSTEKRAVPQVRIDRVLKEWAEWDTVCGYFMATGKEKYLTIGRFTDHYDSKPAGFTPLKKSQGGFNNSAYYLLDMVEIVEDPENCTCTDAVRNTEGERFTFKELDLDLNKEQLKDRSFILDNIYFKFDRADLLPDSYPELDQLFEFMDTNELTLIIEGHTDNIGSDDYNQELSESRARAVYEYLCMKGIDPSRMVYLGFGSSRPINQNDSELNRAMNRRVEVRFESTDLYK